MILFELVERAKADKGVVLGDLVTLQFVLVTPLLLGGGYVPAQLANGHFVIAVDNDIARHGGLGSLDLEVADRKALDGVNIDELGAALVKKLVRSDCALEARDVEVAIGLDNRDTTEACGCLSQSTFAGDEEVLLHLVSGMEAVIPGEYVRGIWQGLP